MPTYGNHEVVHGEGFDDWHDRFPQPDQSDLQGGHAGRGFKVPNPFYFIGP